MLLIRMAKTVTGQAGALTLLIKRIVDVVAKPRIPVLSWRSLEAMMV